MRFRIIGHPDLEQQVREVFATDPRHGPVAVARIRALLESFDEDPADLEPRPEAQESWVQGVRLQVQRGEEPGVEYAGGQVTIYIYETWSLRFAIARVQLPGGAVVGGWLMVESEVAAAAGLATRNLSLALLSKVEELIWPI